MKNMLLLVYQQNDVCVLSHICSSLERLALWRQEAARLVPVYFYEAANNNSQLAVWEQLPLTSLHPASFSLALFLPRFRAQTYWSRSSTAHFLSPDFTSCHLMGLPVTPLWSGLEKALLREQLPVSKTAVEIVPAFGLTQGIGTQTRSHMWSALTPFVLQIFPFPLAKQVTSVCWCDQESF